MSCPAEMPMKKLESEREIPDTFVFKSFAIAGKAGKYMSMEKGPIAAKSPKIMMI